MVSKNTITLRLGSLLVLVLGACADSKVVVSTVNTDIVAEDAAPDVLATNTAITETTGQALSDDKTDHATIASLVGFIVTQSKNDVNDYAGITADGLLTDYSYSKVNGCYTWSSTQIYDRGMGVFWVEDGDVTTELRMARQDENLILFRNEITETGRVVYPGAPTVNLSDLRLCN